MIGLDSLRREQQPAAFNGSGHGSVLHQVTHRWRYGCWLVLHATVAGPAQHQRQPAVWRFHYRCHAHFDRRPLYSVSDARAKCRCCRFSRADVYGIIRVLIHDRFDVVFVLVHECIGVNHDAVCVFHCARVCVSLRIGWEDSLLVRAPNS